MATDVDDYPPLLSRTMRFLQETFRPSSQHQVVFERQEVSWRGVQASHDGSGGCALLTEIHRRCQLPFASNADAKENLKFAAQELRLPLWEGHQQYSIGMRPHREPPSYAQIASKTIGQVLADLPQDLQTLILAFAGDLWWGCTSWHELPGASESLNAFSVIVPPRLTRFFRKCLPFETSRVLFANGQAVFGEWSSDRSLIWLRCVCVWEWILLLRCVRGRRSRTTEIITVRGLGDVII